MVGADLLRELDQRPLRRMEYDKLVESGVFDDERVELLYGSIVRMATKGPTHDAVIQRLTRILVPALLDRAGVRIQSAFAASDESEPEPHVAVVPPGDYDVDHPARALLIIEVADSSLKKDRLKARLYAESGVPEYWIVNLVDKLVEVHTDIVRGSYTRITPCAPTDKIRLRELNDVELAVAQILR